MTNTIAFIVKGYPRLSETFIAQEIRALEQRGLNIRIYSLRHPTDGARHPVHNEINAPIVYLPEYLHNEPRRVLRAWRALRARPSYRAARALWLSDLRRDRTRNRVRRFGQALVLAHELAPDIEQLHAHFLHTPASVARYTAILSGLTWSVSAHAKDVWTTPDWEIREKLTDCAWAVTCNGAAFARLDGLAPERKVSLVYHGLNLTRFPPPIEPRPLRDERNAENPIVILSVGRAVEKKGYDDLLVALAKLPEHLHWRLEHIGGGALLERLKARAASLGLADRIRWHGPQPQEAVLTAYRKADLFVLASLEAANGDRDGLPNVLLEAQSQGLAVIATRISGIPELVIDGNTGRLVAPRDTDGLAATLTELAQDADLRQRLGAAGLRRVHARFALESCLDPLATRFGLARAAA